MSLIPISTTATGESATRAARPRVLALALLGICAATLLAGTATASQGRAPAAGAAKNGIEWHSCGNRLQCGHVRVPLDWDRPHGRRIKLAVIRHLASKPEQRVGSMFTNQGGPAGSVQAVRDDGASLDAKGGGRFNVVGWDVRGAGASTHVRCFRSEKRRARFFDSWSIPTPGKTKSRRIRRKTAALARRCGNLSGRLLRHISAADTARDLDRLRRLVGDRRLTYLGVSDGTFIGQTYANMFPRRVRAMVLDAVVDPVTFTRGTKSFLVHNLLANNERAFEGFLSLCEQAGPARCALAGNGPVAPRVDELFARLRRGPIPAPSADPPRELTYGDAVSAIVVLFSSSPGAWPDLAAALDQAARGDGSDLLTTGRLLTSAFSSQDPTQAPGLSAIALTCANGPAHQAPGAWRKVVKRLTGVSVLYGPVVSWWRWAPCASWPARSADRYTGPWNADTKNPILVIGTRFDPNLPYANARHAARRLGNAVLLTHQGYSHTSDGDPSACVKRSISDYLVDLVTPPRGTVCPSNRQPFDPNFGQPLP